MIPIHDPAADGDESAARPPTRFDSPPPLQPVRFIDHPRDEFRSRLILFRCLRYPSSLEDMEKFKNEFPHVRFYSIFRAAFEAPRSSILDRTNFIIRKLTNEREIT